MASASAFRLFAGKVVDSVIWLWTWPGYQRDDTAPDSMGEPNMSLFDNEREANLESTVAMVEDVLIELGHFVNDCRRDRKASIHGWLIRKGSASIAIDLIEEVEFYTVRVSAVVMTLNEKVDRIALFERALTLNATDVSGAAFALDGEELLLLSERNTLDLDRSELRSLVTVVRNVADEYDDKLVGEFGGTLGRVNTREATPPPPPPPSA